MGDLGSIPELERFLWRREKLPTPVFWPGEFHGLYSPWGCKESDMTEQLSHTHEHPYTHKFYNLDEVDQFSEKQKLLYLIRCETAYLNNLINESSSVKARILIAVPFSRGSGKSQTRDQTQVSHITGGFYTIWATREAWITL